jgi:hypothetical protein
VVYGDDRCMIRVVGKIVKVSICVDVYLCLIFFTCSIVQNMVSYAYCV